MESDKNTDFTLLSGMTKRVMNALNGQIEALAQELPKADEQLKREVEKLIETASGDDPSVLQALTDSVHDMEGKSDLSAKLERFAAQSRLRQLVAKHGTIDVVRVDLEKQQADVKTEKGKLQNTMNTIHAYEKRMKPINEHNKDYSSFSINEDHKDRLQNTGTLASIFDSDCDDAFRTARSAYKAYTHYDSSGTETRDYFDDLDSLKKERAAEKVQTQIVQAAEDLHFQTVGDFTQMLDCQKIVESGSVPSQDELRKIYSEKFRNDDFVRVASKYLSNKDSAPVFSAAAMATTQHALDTELKKVRDDVAKTASALEEYSGAQPNDWDDLAADIKDQVMLGGYMALSSDRMRKALTFFKPDVVEGPLSLKRDLQIHLMTEGHVDPAFVHEITGLDRHFARALGVNTALPNPDLKSVLSDPAELERLDRRLAAFLRESVASTQTAPLGNLFLNKGFSTAANGVDVANDIGAPTVQEDNKNEVAENMHPT